MNIYSTAAAVASILDHLKPTTLAGIVADCREECGDPRDYELCRMVADHAEAAGIANCGPEEFEQLVRDA